VTGALRSTERAPILTPVLEQIATEHHGGTGFNGHAIQDDAVDATAKE
jgi:hypothetical protein